MKIERTINGVKFNIELLPDEMVDAYFEQQKKFDIEDVINYGEAYSLEDMKEYVGCDYQTYLNNKEAIAKRMRRYIDNGLSMPEAREIAVDEVINEVITAALA